MSEQEDDFNPAFLGLGLAIGVIMVLAVVVIGDLFIIFGIPLIEQQFGRLSEIQEYILYGIVVASILIIGSKIINNRIDRSGI